MDSRCQVVIGRFAEKQLKRTPKYILEALSTWATTIEQFGIRAIRKHPGYHDELLKGERAGQRSSRLNRAYRVIYEEHESGDVIVIAVLEVNKHDYS